MTIDPERIARLLDGKLDPGERDKLLAEIGASEGATDVLADAMSVMREGEGSGEGSGVVPLRPKRRIHPSIWMALAAGIVAVLLVPRGLRTPSSDAVQETSFVALLAQPGDTWPSMERAPWGQTRGAGDVEAGARAVRIGARLTELEIALRSGDPSDRQIAADIAAMVEQIPGGSIVANQLRDSASIRVDVRRVYDDVAAMAGPEEVAAGAWLQAARVAAQRGDSDFFKSGTSRTMSKRLVVSSFNEAALTDLLSRKARNPR